MTSASTGWALRWTQNPDGVGRIGFVQGDDGRSGHPPEIAALADRPDDDGPAGELRGQSPDTAQHPVHQDRQAGDRAVGGNGPVGGDPRDPQAGADVVA